MENKKREIIEKYGLEVWNNMDRLAEFMARMIMKYGPEIFKESKKEGGRTGEI